MRGREAYLVCRSCASLIQVDGMTGLIVCTDSYGEPCVIHTIHNSFEIILTKILSLLYITISAYTLFCVWSLDDLDVLPNHFSNVLNSG